MAAAPLILETESKFWMCESSDSNGLVFWVFFIVRHREDPWHTNAVVTPPGGKTALDEPSFFS